MKQTVQFPLRTVSENVYRGGNWRANAARSSSQRQATRLVLASQLARRPLQLEGSGGERVSNFFTVLLVRIAAGELDDDNLRGAMKAVRDEVADWLGLDDRDRRVRFFYHQQPCPRGQGATRIEVEDLKDADETICKVVGANPAVLGAASEGSLRGRPRRGEVQSVRQDARGGSLRGGAEGSAGDGRERGDGQGGALPDAAPEQQRLAFMKCYALLPWDQDGSGDPVVTELPQLDGEEPPLSVTVRAPRHTKQIAELQGGARSLQLVSEGSVVTLRRHRWRHEELGEVWIFIADDQPPAMLQETNR